LTTPAGNSPQIVGFEKAKPSKPKRTGISPFGSSKPAAEIVVLPKR
jgi:hypothetical protein